MDNRQTASRTVHKRISGRLKRGKADISFLLFVLLLLCCGLIMVFSADMPTSVRDWIANPDAVKTPFSSILSQLFRALLGLIAMLVAMNFDYRLYKRYALPIFIASYVLMLLVPFIGIEVNGAKRWLGVGSFSFQPSEVFKIAVIIAFASLLSEWSERKIESVKNGIVPVFAFIFVCCLATLIQKHMSATILIAGLIICMYFIAGMKWKHLLVMAGTGVAAAFPLIMLVGYRADRIKAWLAPFSDIRGICWQIANSLYAIGSGGLFGMGLGESREKHLWLPEASNDYIFSVLCEELGFIGAAAVIALFAVFLWKGFSIALKAPDRFGSLLVAGIMSMMALQIVINIGVVTNLLPSTGMQLPFFSSGGTSLLFVMGAMGMVLNVSRYRKSDESLKK